MKTLLILISSLLSLHAFASDSFEFDKSNAYREAHILGYSWNAPNSRASNILQQALAQGPYSSLFCAQLALAIYVQDNSAPLSAEAKAIRDQSIAGYERGCQARVEFEKARRASIENWKPQEGASPESGKESTTVAPL